MGNLPQGDSGAPDLIPTAAVAELLGVTVSTVNRWADAGELPVAYKVPGLRGARLFDRRVVEARRQPTQVAS